MIVCSSMHAHCAHKHSSIPDTQISVQCNPVLNAMPKNERILM